jgi:hypothetical protein
VVVGTDVQPAARNSQGGAPPMYDG